MVAWPINAFYTLFGDYFARALEAALETMKGAFDGSSERHYEKLSDEIDE